MSTFTAGQKLRVADMNQLWETYTPVWGASNTQPSVGNGSLVGRYSKSGRNVLANIFLAFGSTTNGGTGSWTFTLPFAAAAGREQQLNLKLWCGSGNYAGVAYVNSGGTVLNLLAPSSASSPVLNPVQNANSAGAVGTGIPAVSGAFSFGINNNVSMFGIYEAAA